MNPTTMLWLSLGAAALAVLYGISSRCAGCSPPPAGNARMQEIAAAIQAGAQAYMNRQYTTIAIVGRRALRAPRRRARLANGGRLRVGAVLSGLAGYIGMFVSVRANVRTAQAATRVSTPRSISRSGRRHHGHARRRLGAARRRRLLMLCWARMGVPRSARSLHALVGLALRRLADLDLRAARRRHLHEGRRTSAPTSSARSKPAFPRTIRATRPSSPTTSATTSATAPAWPRTCSRPTRSRSSRRCCSAASRPRSRPRARARSLYPFVLGAAVDPRVDRRHVLRASRKTGKIMQALYKRRDRLRRAFGRDPCSDPITDAA